MSNPKLRVDVVSAYNILPTDGQGSSNAFVELNFDGQRLLTTTIEKNLNPDWNESFCFNIFDPLNYHNLTLDACVYSSATATSSRSFIGKISLTGNLFCSYSDAAVTHYPLIKKRRLSWSSVRGELGLKVYVTDDPSIRPSTPIAVVGALGTMDPSVAHGSNQGVSNPVTNTSPNAEVEIPRLRNPSHGHQLLLEYAPADGTASGAIVEAGTRHNFPQIPNPSQLLLGYAPADETASTAIVTSSTAIVEAERGRNFRHASTPADETASTAIVTSSTSNVEAEGSETRRTSQRISNSSSNSSQPSNMSDAAADEAANETTSTSNNSEVGTRPTCRHSPNPSYDRQRQQHPPVAPEVYDNAFKYEAHEFSLTETSPKLGGGRVASGRVIHGEKTASVYDLVEQMYFLYVRVVKAHDLPAMDVTGRLAPYTEVRVGKYKWFTNYYEKEQNPVWNEVFAFSGDRLKSSVLEVLVRDNDADRDDHEFVGIVKFDIPDVPLRVPPESDNPLAPQWYRIEDNTGHKASGELMLAVWFGTQADEAFPGAWHSDNASSRVDIRLLTSTVLGSKVYHAPRLWYLRVNVIEAHNLFIDDKNRFPYAYVQVKIGNQVSVTQKIQAQNLNPLWNEDLFLVAAEPFEDHLIISVYDHVSPRKDEIIGRVTITLQSVDRRADDSMIRGRWYKLEKPVAVDQNESEREKLSSSIHLRLCLEGGYHVANESPHYNSDLRPSSKKLWRPSIGVLELGILDAVELHPMKTRDGRGTTDAYCVAKYGHKWFRTRTIVGELCPRYHEQYIWEVFDVATVLTVGVFDNNLQFGNGSRHAMIGKVRIRISSLEAGRVYTHRYPLLAVHPSGVKKMGELHLAVRFSCTSFVKTLYSYSQPQMPKMHYLRPITAAQLDMLRMIALYLVKAHFSRADPPLTREVVEYMCDGNCHLWSIRRSRANFFRLATALSGVISAGKWFWEICMWKNPIMTVLAHVFFLMLVCFPQLILPTAFLCMVLSGLWNFHFRARCPPHINIKLSQLELVNLDELDEEFCTYPTSQNMELVGKRYDRLRSNASSVQALVGDMASLEERFQLLLSWRDRRATVLFVTFCIAVTFVLYVTPFTAVAAFAGLIVMMPPRFRHMLPTAAFFNFFSGLPTKTDTIF
ncbi:FT-interacting protein 3-like [Prunus dulcis]|uniref:FT-interacting protein 3-like n=1 Tax=Prunus dulcis TaxID=3755 RepID=UPI0014820B50|nr:FT-interacting protein 3-like [Prunus dulcis]